MPRRWSGKPPWRKERSMIARELHDSIASRSPSSRSDPAAAARCRAKGDAAKRDRSIDELDVGVRECYSDVRELLVHFRTRTSEGTSRLRCAPRCRSLSTRRAWPHRCPWRGHGVPLPPDVQIQVLHMVQEALSNVRKHVKATQVELRVERHPRWRFEVRDDGMGFEGRAGSARFLARRPGYRASAPAHWRGGAGAVAPRAGHPRCIELPAAPCHPHRQCHRRRKPARWAAAPIAPFARPPSGAIDVTQPAAAAPVTLLVVDDHLVPAWPDRPAGAGCRPACGGRAGDAAEALRLVPTLQPDVILLDNHLPGVMGWTPFAACVKCLHARAC